jgi:capsular exopolysaccharide synthesis family protein
VAAAGVLGLEQIDESVHAPDAVERLLGVPLLGAVPQVDDSSDVVDLLGDPKSGVYEAYFSIRSSLALTTDHGVPRTLLVTSTRPAEGKSVTSISLATVLMRTGRKVLVVDADMRSPSISSKLELPNNAGLSNVLAGTDDWQGLVTRLSDRGFDVLTAGPMPPSASELLSGDRMSELLDQAAKVYDHIVIDAPPLLALADSLLLARAVEGAILVVEAGGVSVRAIKASLSRLQAHQAHVLGVVLTKLRRSRAGESYGYGYGYGYGYEYGQTRADAAASS